ncbi:YitT family protein [Paenibacillus soyae]|uniref:YitT family protein n=1 Tax=Paenibacillus soyae TaxID=2969249 RepID=A0A9X2MWM7_9BACL|nr:YitT family protein [Paenibacillus soyae]MCR2807258.1 YitT family protein [Paenibacillus soyae]
MLLLTGSKMKVMMQKWLQIVIGCFITAGGLLLLQHSGVVTGGTAGLSLSLAPLLGISFPVLFALLNLPFFLFSYFYMGKSFTFKTILAIVILTSMSSLSALLPDFVLPSVVGAIGGGVLIGVGISTLFRNGASLGGATLLAVYLHKKHGVNPGKTNFVFDFIVILTSLAAFSIVSGLLSVLSIAVTSVVISLMKRKIKHGSPAEAQPLQTAVNPS